MDLPWRENQYAQSAISVRYTLGTDGDPGTSDADGSDYTDGGGGAVEIAAGASGAVIEITINDDEEIESAREVFALTLDTPRGDAGYALGVVATAAVTIEEGVCDRSHRGTGRGTGPCRSQGTK